jgi:hypothetical protein
MSRIDDRHHRARIEQAMEVLGDAVGQILLEHEPSRQHIDEPADARQTGDPLAGKDRDVGFAFCGQQVVRADEHERQARRDQRAAPLYRETPTDRALGRRQIAREEDVRERACRGLRRRPKCSLIAFDSERIEEVAQGTLRPRKGTLRQVERAKSRSGVVVKDQRR